MFSAFRVQSAGLKNGQRSQPTTHLMSKRAAGIAILVLMISASWLWLYLTLRPKGIDLGPYEVLGAQAAAETAKVLKNSGRIILVDATFGDYRILAPINAAQIKSFQKRLRQTSLKVAAIDKVALAPPSMGRDGIFMKSGEIAQVLARWPDADALVLFVGLAGPGELKRDKLPAQSPKLIVIGNYERYYKTLLGEGTIQLAIVPRAPTESESPQPIDPRAWFERNYLVETPERAGQLPD